jgi:hypothetical protein
VDYRPGGPDAFAASSLWMMPQPRSCTCLGAAR